MAHPERFERPTPRFVVWCSIQLSYGCLPLLKADTYSEESGDASLFAIQLSFLCSAPSEASCGQ